MEPHRQSNPDSFALNESTKSIRRDLGSSLPRPVAGGLLDPFTTYPECETKDADINILLKYYLTNVVFKYFPWQPPSETNPTITYYVPLILGDAVLFHAILQLSYLRLNNDTKIAELAIQEGKLMGKTISLLRKRIEVEASVSDQTIAAVANLAAIEHERGNMTRLRMHMFSLKRMVLLRGGLQGIRESNPMVANLIFWTFTIAIYEIPFPPLDPVLPRFFPRQQKFNSSFSDLSPLSSHSICLPSTAKYLSEPIYDILISVRHVSQLVPNNGAYPTASANLLILTRLMSLLSYLLSLPHLISFNEYFRLLSESTRYATLLHVFAPWRGLPPDATLAISHLLHRLISFLQPLLVLKLEDQRAMEGEMQSEISTLIFWIVAVGGIAAKGAPEWKWFAGRLKDMCDELGVKVWNDWQEIVQRAIWHDILCKPLHKQLWNEVQLLRDQDNALEIHRGDSDV